MGEARGEADDIQEVVETGLPEGGPAVEQQSLNQMHVRASYFYRYYARISHHSLYFPKRLQHHLAY